MAVESKTRELLADIFIKALDEENIPQDTNITASTR